MFEINDLNFKEVGDEVLLMDDFYKEPQEILDLIKSSSPFPFKSDDCPSFNLIHFADLRHMIKCDDLAPTYRALGLYCGQRENDMTMGNWPRHTALTTNCMRLTKTNKWAEEFNDYHNKHWCPHLDVGWNGIVYFTEGAGTNLYHPSFDTREDPRPEHYSPWVDKSRLEVVHHLESKFNRLVFFNGKRYPHGMDIIDDTYFNSLESENEDFFWQDKLGLDNFRINQVFFFEEEPV